MACILIMKGSKACCKEARTTDMMFDNCKFQIAILIVSITYDDVIKKKKSLCRRDTQRIDLSAKAHHD